MDNDKYLSYKDYQDLGGTLDPKSFNLLEYKSRKQIDYYTHNRLTDGIPSDIKNDIELVMMDLIRINNVSKNSTGKQSESIDGYSVSYGGTQANSSEVENTIETLLSGIEIDGIPLTYAGGVNDNKRIYYFVPQD